VVSNRCSQLEKERTMKVKFVLESNIVVDMTVSLGDLIVLDKFLTDHGGELTRWSTETKLHRDIRSAIRSAADRLENCGVSTANRFDDVIEYKVTKETTKEDA